MRPDAISHRSTRRARINGDCLTWFIPCLLLLACLLVGLASRAQTLSNSASQVAWSNALADTNIAPDFNVTTNPAPAGSGGLVASNSANARLQLALYDATTVQPEKAEPLLVGLLAGDIPVPIQKAALLELGTVVADENDLARAESIYGQYVDRWPNDVKVPEILLRQGQLFRRMGLDTLAQGKFYSVMTAALSLKSDQLAYYQNLVLQTQVEIAETHYLAGQYADAADFYSRLLQNPDPALNHAQIQFRLIRSLAQIQKHELAVAEAREFVARYPEADQVPEVRYYLAQSLKALGQNNEALQEVLLCLREQKSRTRTHPAVWAYWQQRIGNEIGNQLFHEGDYVDSLEIYRDLAQLDTSADWQVPVEYQVGVTCEKLAQPALAVAAYNAILARDDGAQTNATSALQAVFDMARWRLKFIQWQTNAEAAGHLLVAGLALPPALTTNLQTSLAP